MALTLESPGPAGPPFGPASGSGTTTQQKNMHYKNGRIAKQGDPVITIDYAGNVQVGVIFDLNTAASTCNAQLQRPLGCAMPVSLSDCYHAQDALVSMEVSWMNSTPPQEPKP